MEPQTVEQRAGSERALASLYEQWKMRMKPACKGYKSLSNKLVLSCKEQQITTETLSTSCVKMQPINPFGKFVFGEEMILQVNEQVSNPTKNWFGIEKMLIKAGTKKESSSVAASVVVGWCFAKFWTDPNTKTRSKKTHTSPSVFVDLKKN